MEYFFCVYWIFQGINAIETNNSILVLVLEAFYDMLLHIKAKKSILIKFD